MIILENQIITKTISNLENYFKQIREILNNKPQYKKEYNSLFIDYRELLGKKVWLNDTDFPFEKELVDNFLDLEKDIKDFINKIQ